MKELLLRHKYKWLDKPKTFLGISISSVHNFTQHILHQYFVHFFVPIVKYSSTMVGAAGLTYIKCNLIVVLFDVKLPNLFKTLLSFLMFEIVYNYYRAFQNIR